ncbi:preprotein translocase subunit Sec61beta [Candidatus Micrarchaeota archaeon]|nr:preprotein translocase subunit Sec61beta [Candidatus Micrarchaeota archaeon]
MAQEKIRTPSSSAGLIRFYDVTTSNIKIDPRTVIGMCIGVILIEVFIQVLLA